MDNNTCVSCVFYTMTTVEEHCQISTGNPSAYEDAEGILLIISQFVVSGILSCETDDFKIFKVIFQYEKCLFGT